MPDSWLAAEKPVCLSDFGCRSVGGQQKNQSLKEGVICYSRGTFLLNLSTALLFFSFASHTQPTRFSWVYLTYFSSSYPAIFFSLGISDPCWIPIPSRFLFLGYIRPMLTLYTQSLSFPWVYSTYVDSLHPVTFFSLGISDLFYFSIPHLRLYLLLKYSRCYKVFHASLLIRHDENGRKYLYDIIDIKKETSYPLEP